MSQLGTAPGENIQSPFIHEIKKDRYKYCLALNSPRDDHAERNSVVLDAVQVEVSVEDWSEVCEEGY